MHFRQRCRLNFFLPYAIISKTKGKIVIDIKINKTLIIIQKCSRAIVDS